MAVTEQEFPQFEEVDRSLLGRPIEGPTALGTDYGRLWNLTWTLAVTDFKLTFFGSVLGYLWQLMKPLMLFGVLYVVFSEFLDFSSNEKYFPVALLLGIVMFGFMSEATSQAVPSLVTREPLVRKVDFPRMAVPLASVLTALFNFLLNLIPVCLFLLLAGGRPRWSWLAMPPLIVVFVLFVAGLAMLLSALYVRYRDVQPIWDVVLQSLFYATPIFYTLDLVEEKSGSELLPKIIMANPFATILQSARHLLIDPSYEAPVSAMGGWQFLLIPIGIGVVLFILGYRVFSREAPRIAEDL